SSSPGSSNPRQPESTDRTCYPGAAMPRQTALATFLLGTALALRLAAQDGHPQTLADCRAQFQYRPHAAASAAGFWLVGNRLQLQNAARRDLEYLQTRYPDNPWLSLFLAYSLEYSEPHEPQRAEALLRAAAHSQAPLAEFRAWAELNQLAIAKGNIEAA